MYVHMPVSFMLGTLRSNNLTGKSAASHRHVLAGHGGSYSVLSPPYAGLLASVEHGDTERASQTQNLRRRAPRTNPR